MAVQNVDRLLAKLRRIDERTHEHMRNAVATSALLVERDMKASIQRGPKSGRLYRRSSIKKRATTALRGIGLRQVPQQRGKVIAGVYFHRASAPGEPPATDTGRLVSSIATVFPAQQQGMAALIGVQNVSAVQYAPGLEHGTRHMRARPFVRPALTKNLDRIRSILRAAALAGLRGA